MLRSLLPRRSRSMPAGVLSALGFLAVCSLASRADPVKVNFTGHVVSVDDMSGLLDGSITAGETYSGSYVFDSATPVGGMGGTTTSYYYLNPTTQGFAPFMLGDYTFLHDSATNFAVDIAVTNDDPRDGYTVQDNAFRPDHGMFTTQGNLVNIYDSTGTVFASQSLPSSAPDRSRFDQDASAITLETGNSVAGHIYLHTDTLTNASLTPTPEFGSVFSLGGLLAAGGTGLWLQRKRRKA